MAASVRCSSSAPDSTREYTGLANIELAAALLGLSPREIAGKRDQIIAFADIGEHIGDPIKTYSSGMVVRLGFAIATALRPDIMITDEVLAVGDESFQKKCIAWMEGYLADGGTLLLCSHSMYHIRKLCRNALWLKEGRVRDSGTAADVAQAYLAYHEEKTAGERQPCRGPWRPPPASTRSSPSSSCRMSGSCRGIRSRCARKCTRRTGAFRSC